MSQFALLPVRDANLRVGLLGGSFNPAHDGHVHISLQAIKRLGLDFVIWLISPQNPLKSKNITADIDQRVKLAEHLTKNHAKIIISDIERFFPNCYTANSIKRIKSMHKNMDLFWIMGADNMLQINRWYKWKQIFASVPVTIFDREDFAYKIFKSKAAQVFKNSNINQQRIIRGNAKDRFWSFIRIKKSPLSSTQIRSKNVK